MPLVQDKAFNLPASEIASTIDHLMMCFDEVYNLQIQGGEPLIHPDITFIIKHILKYDNRIRNIWIMSNGTVTPNEELLRTLSRTKIAIAFSHYDINKDNYTIMKKKLKTFNIQFRRRKYHEWHDFSIHFQKQEYPAEALAQKLDMCPMNRASSIKNNKIFLCSRLANFDMVIPGYKSDGLELSDRKTGKKFLHKYFSNNCAHCQYKPQVKHKPGTQQ
ncbi:MAG: hypothetical protein NC324_01880 [Bacteroides sp.]|nr:hypothetical protein [Bacteroides sp.]